MQGGEVTRYLKRKNIAELGEGAKMKTIVWFSSWEKEEWRKVQWKTWSI